jgi:hypothetical protein
MPFNLSRKENRMPDLGCFLKKFLLISTVITFAFFIGSQTSADDDGFRIATFQCDVSPPLDGHPLIWVLKAKTLETPLLARGVILENGRNRYLLCAVDWCGLCNSSYELFRQKLANAAGAPLSNVAVQCVHPHTAPYTDGDAQKILDKVGGLPMFCDFEFMDRVTDRLAGAVKGALGRLEPFDSIGVGSAVVDQVASSRRIHHGGKFYGRSSSTKDPKLRALPEGRIDPVLKTISFMRDKKPLVRLHYYATHPQTFYGDPRISSDMPGFARAEIEKTDPAMQIYFNGCGGDIAMGKYNDRSPKSRDELTGRLVDAMRRSIESTRYELLKSIVWRTADVRLPERIDTGYSLEDNIEKLHDLKQSKRNRLRAATRIAFTQRIDRPIELTSLQLNDDLYIVNLCGECLLEFQLYAQRVRPDVTVAVAAYGDLGPGYICPDAEFEVGGYEPSASRAGQGCEPIMKRAIDQLLGK